MRTESAFRIRLARPLVLGLRAACACVVLLVACGDGPTGAPAAPCPTERCVLFIGGSLTWTHDVPGMVVALARAAGEGTVTVGTSYLGGASLADHWRDGAARAAIASRAWDVVVLEQGPSARPESRVLLRDYVARFAPLIRQAGAEPALYMTWPTFANRADFPESSTSWHLAAADVNAMLFAVGDAWRAAWQRDPDLPLYGPDGWHPAEQGAYLAALVMVGALFDRSTVGLPATLTLDSGAQVAIPASSAPLLQAAADEVNGR